MQKIDTDTLKNSIDLRLLTSQYTTLRGREGAKEWYGPCPKCGGKDRFHVTQTGFFCSHCHGERSLKHDVIEFIQWVEGLDFRAACEWLAGDHLPTLPSSSTKLSKPTHPPKVPNPPGPQWQGRARTFVEYAQKLLWQPEGKPGLDYLLSRGFLEETIRTAGLGYNLRDINDRPGRWGVTHKDNIWLPGPGIVIPWLIKGDHWRLNIRLLEPRIIRDKGGKESEITKIGPAGSDNGLYNADALNATCPAILVEGELDALTLIQYAGDIIIAVATGGTDMSRHNKWIARLAAAPMVLIAFDADAPGDEAAKWWLKTLPQARRWRPFWKDANAMAMGDVDIRAWIEAGLKCYYPTPKSDELEFDPWVAAMIREAQALGGVVN